MQFAHKGKENSMVYMSMTSCSSVAVGLWNKLTSNNGNLSAAEIVDFGIVDEATIDAYCRAIDGGVTLEQLNDALGDGPALTKLIGHPITTAWDDLPPEE